MHNITMEKKIIVGIIIVFLLSICLFIGTKEVIYTGISLKGNRLLTGSVMLNLNDGKPILQENEVIFVPGETVERDFFLENTSTEDVYYRLYLENISGDLASVLVITIKDGERTLYSSTVQELTKDKSAGTQLLSPAQRKKLTISFYFPENSGNGLKNKSLSFTMCAEAAQVHSNPDKAFN